MSQQSESPPYGGFLSIKGDVRVVPRNVLEFCRETFQNIYSHYCEERWELKDIADINMAILQLQKYLEIQKPILHAKKEPCNCFHGLSVDVPCSNCGFYWREHK